MNQGEVCGQHLNNVVVYSPCFHGDELVGFAANRAHWVDIGGMHQGFGSSGTTDIYAEGLQMRSLKIYEAGERNETLWQIIRDNVRYPDASLGDLRAQIASCQLGARRYAELIARYGRDTVEACIAKVWDQAELAARRVVESIPDGRYEAESFLDNDGRNLTTPLRVKVAVQVQGSQLTVDFTEMNPQVPSPLNSGRSGGIAAARVAFKALTSPDLDVNEGCFRPLDVILPEGTMLSAKPPAALGRWSIALPTVIDTILKALSPAVPHLIPAAHKGDMGGCSFFGFRPDGSRFLLMNIFGGGWGGRPDEDGEFGQRLGLPGRRAQHAGRIAGDQISGAGRSARVAQRQRRRRPLPRRSRPRSDLSDAAALQGQHQLRAHARSALGPVRRQVCGHQCRHHPPCRRRPGRGRLQGDRDRDRRWRQRDVPDRRRRRLWRSARARARGRRPRSRRRYRFAAGSLE